MRKIRVINRTFKGARSQEGGKYGTHGRSLISDVCQSSLSLGGSFPETTLASFSKDYSRLPHYVLATVGKTSTAIRGRE